MAFLIRRFAQIASACALLLSLQSAVHAEWSWIWSAAPEAADTAQVRRQFEVPDNVREATLLVTCDNGARVFLNGELLLTNRDWSSPSRATITEKLRPGINELRAEVKNEGGAAGFVARLRMQRTRGRDVIIETDASWEASVADRADWQPARVLAKYGSEPWGDPFDIGSGRPLALAPDQITVQPGFKVELLYTVPRGEQGSWVSLTVDPVGRLLACDQYGSIYRITPPPIGSTAEARIETLTNNVGGAHGLLHAFDSLYVMVNEQGGRQGLWRLRDTNQDGQYDSEELLRKIEGGGEHGPHAVVLSPDGKSLYIASGNHTKLPENMEYSRAPRAWAEDHITERLWDANGHARGILAPGGYICKTDPDGSAFELISHGYRNEYGIAFNALGDLFTFDSDMEWDAGSPWYRPTRINLATSGSEMGWRSGAGKWPTYYPDSLPALVDIGPGSPTGVASGQGAKFPARYQHAIFANDWTYGTMYAIHLTPEGAAYRAEAEEFLSGRPLPLTDVLVHPKDGAMYFAVGGRRTQSALYRVVYTGSESTAPAPGPAPTPEHQLRRRIEALHAHDVTQPDLTEAWRHLAHSDRWIRFAARTAIERQPAHTWAKRALAETRPVAAIEAAIALARVGKSEHRDALLAQLNGLDISTLEESSLLGLARAYQLALIRLGHPEGSLREQTIARLNALYPAPSDELNRELAALLIALDAPTAVAKTVQLLITAGEENVSFATDALLSRNSGYAKAFAQAANTRPNQQQIALAYVLRTAKTGWNPSLRKAYFNWFPRTSPWQGGNSFRGFIENIRKESLEKVSDPDERAALDTLSSRQDIATATADFPAPVGPGQVYTTAEAVRLVDGNLKNRDFNTGRAMFNSTGCAACHRFAAAGGGLGPDLTGSASRYTLTDLLENIVEPSKVISDQYGSEEIELKDGSILVGRAYEADGKLVVAIDPQNPEEAEAVSLDSVMRRQPYPVSMMPPGLINSMNPDELRDLIAYILSAGNPDDRMFKKP